MWTLPSNRRRRWKPKLISISTAVDAEILRSRLQTSGVQGIEVVHGPAGTVRVATHPEVDFVVSAIVGVAGLEATYEAVRPERPSGWPIKNAWWPPAS